MSVENTSVEPHHRTEVGPCYWKTGEGREYFFREPTLMDGARLWKMALESRGLDINSPYAYLMLAGHFADTCVVAERRRRPVGFVSAFIRPAAPDIVFVWQIAVSESERGQGLGQRLLHQLLARPACRRVTTLEATVTKSNQASRALFDSLARDLDVPLQIGHGLDSKLFPDEVHESEDLVRIGPLPPPRRAVLPQAGLEGDEIHEPSNDEYAADPQPGDRDRARRHRSA